MTIGIVGIGLIGGSLAKSASNLGHKVVGYDANPAHVNQALQLGIIQESLSLKEVTMTSDIVAVCVPVSVVIEVTKTILDVQSPATIIELSSTKEVIAKALEQHPNRRRLVLTHPMAGTEFSGPSAAVDGLFKGKTVVLCDLEKSDPSRVEQVENLYSSIGMRPVELASGPHDVHVAYVSHISHISSFALSLTVLEKERDEKQIFNLASGGFASTVRLAKSNPATWSPIFEHNRDHVLDVLDEYINVLAEFRTALIKNNFSKVAALMKKANEIAPLLPEEPKTPQTNPT